MIHRNPPVLFKHPNSNAVLQTSKQKIVTEVYMTSAISNMPFTNGINRN